MTLAFAVLGQPVAHSLSPRIHRQFARDTGIDLSYRAIEVAPADFLAFWLDCDLAGANITMPLKQLACRFASPVSERAARAGAVNTLTRQSRGRYAGDNTDGAGLLRDLTDNLALRLRGTRVLVIGAGGAARGILGPLQQAGPERVLVANRTASRAEQLAAMFGAEGCGLDALARQGRFDAVIHASGAGYDRFPDLPAQMLEDGAWCYDLSYGSAARPFRDWALGSGCTAVHDGLGMLVEQAAESFALWHDVRPPTAQLLEILRSEENLT